MLRIALNVKARWAGAEASTIVRCASKSAKGIARRDGIYIDLCLVLAGGESLDTKITLGIGLRLEMLWALGNADFHTGQANFRVTATIRKSDLTISRLQN